MGHTEEMKAMIRNEVQSISNLEERVVFKQLMEGVFLTLYETNETMYQELEQRVMDELAYDVNRYLIRTGIIERQYMDRSHHLMFPIDESDLTEQIYKMSDIVEAIKENGRFCLMKIMVQCDYMQLQEIWRSSLRFNAVLDTGETKEIIVELRPNQSYLNGISHLYQLFVKNGIPWQTVNAPYLYKMADVVITDLPDNIKGNEKIKEIRIDFGRYSQYIRYDLIPIWNIERIKLDTIGFPVPCEDHKNYQHIISIRNYGEENAYLIDDNLEIQSISQRRNKIFAISGSDEPKKWDIYMIKNAEDNKLDFYTYPIMQNLRREDFTEKFQRKWNQSIKTKAELTRFISGFGLERYVKYQDCEIAEKFEGTPETYCMNSFIEDEIRDNRHLKKLILYFKPGAKDPWLIRDVASFIVSEIQRIYPEYECGGKLL